MTIVDAFILGMALGAAGLLLFAWGAITFVDRRFKEDEC